MSGELIVFLVVSVLWFLLECEFAKSGGSDE